MKNSVKRAAVVILAVFITACIVVPASAADTYYYAIIDGKLFPCTLNYMPMQTKDGILCPSQFLLDAGLDFKYDNKTDPNLYTIYNSEKYLIFDLVQNYAFDARWSYYEAKITRLNGVYYLPLDFINKYFNFLYSELPTQYGTAVRLKSKSDTVSDEDVLAALDRQLALAQNSYKNVNSPSTAPSVAPSAAPSVAPTPSPRPAPAMYLSFDLNMDGALLPVLDILADYGAEATFFAPPEYIESNHDDVRRIIGNGHSLGIQTTLDMNSDELTGEMLEQFSFANRELRTAALTQTRIVSMPAGGAAVKISSNNIDALTEAGYRLWEWKIDAKDWNTKAKTDTLTANLMTAITKSDNACHVRFSCNDTTVEVLEKLLPQLKQLDAAYYAISEARPPNYRT